MNAQEIARDLKTLNDRMGAGLDALVREQAKPTEQVVVTQLPVERKARLANTLRGFWGGISQPQWDAIEAVLDGVERPQPMVGLTPADYAEAARALGGTVAQVRAVDKVESKSGWFTDVRQSILDLDGEGGFIDGSILPAILFEAHKFDQFTKGKFRKSHPNISSRRWNRALYVGGQGEWERLHRAMELDRTAALKSASVGRFQIMGFNHKLAGYLEVEAFWNAMKASEANHLSAFVSFIISAGLLGAFRKISNDPETCRAFAKGYNGGGYATHGYHTKIAAAHRQYS